VKSTVERLSPTRVRINVEVPFDELKPDFDRAYRKIAQQVRIPGFRQGKAPARVVEARFGRAAATNRRALATDDATLPHRTRSATATRARTAATTGDSSAVTSSPSRPPPGHATTGPGPSRHQSHGPSPPGRQSREAATGPSGSAPCTAAAANSGATTCAATPWKAIDAATRTEDGDRRLELDRTVSPGPPVSIFW